jgi:DNA polymerase-3 subunit alpha
MSFVHLHCHSEYSLLDGANRVTDLIHRAREYEQPALALTDHGVMFGAWTFQEQARKSGIKPIVGMEAYVAPGSRRDRTKARDEKSYYHLVIIARDYRGYQNLTKLSSIGYTEGFYYKPRIDREVLARHSEGLIITSACMAGEVAQHLSADRWDAAREAASWHAEQFPDRYYLEVQAHDTPGQEELNSRIFKLAEETGIPVVATNDAHFLRPEDHPAHDVLLCIGLGKDHSDPDRMKYDGGLYFKNHLEMAERFPERPDVIENTLRIADEVNLEFPKKYYVPEFPLAEEGFDNEADMLRDWVWRGAERHYGIQRDHPEHGEGSFDARGEHGNPSVAGLPQDDNAADTRDDKAADAQNDKAAIRARIEYELGVITELGYSGYFLITADFIRWARDHGIAVGPGRGSAAGSIVAYCTGITDICPIRFDLLFERFLNPERVSMPDIDVDFCYERRGEVIEYVREKYGRDAVGQIISFGTMKSRAVVKDVGRTLGFLPAETDRITKLIPNSPNNSMTVEQATQNIAEIRELYETEDRYRKLLDYSMTLEGLSRHASVHAAGVVIAPGPLDEYVPVCTQSTKGAGNGDGESVIVTQYDMNCLEKAGMLKMDFLGLKTLTVIQDAVASIVARHGALRHPDTRAEYARAEDIPLDDQGVYAMLSRGGTAGVFQFESPLATDKLRLMRPDRFDDLVAANALVRPGPLDMKMDLVYIRRKLGQEEVRYPHPDLAEVLEPTYGVIVYQEQMMRIAQILAGFSLAEADVLRKAVGKKDAELIKKELGSFISKAVAKGHEPRLIQDLADHIEAFGRYGFNKSHSAAYSLLAYQTAWLKCYYPAEFMAAMLSAVLDKADEVVRYIAACREMGKALPDRAPQGLDVLPPHVNESNLKFNVVGDGVGQIRFGLAAIRGVGEGAVRSIIAARETEGPFKSLFDFLSRIDLRLCNKRVVEALVGAGALDGFAPSGRGQLSAALEATFAAAQDTQRERDSSQGGLFDLSAAGGASVVQEPPLPSVKPWSEAERLQREKDILGFFISGHPLDKFRDELALFDGANTANLKDHRDKKVEIPCVVTAAARQISKRDGAEWGRISIEDYHGTASVLAFGETWAQFKAIAAGDAPVLLSGGVSGRERDEDDPPIFLDKVVLLESLRESGEVGICLNLSAGEHAPEMVARARTALAEHPGPAPVTIVWHESEQGSGNGGGNGASAVGPSRLRSRTLTITPSRELMHELRDALGDERVRLTRA